MTDPFAKYDKKIDKENWRWFKNGIWKDIPGYCIGRMFIVKMAIIPEGIYRYNTHPVKIPKTSFKDLE